MDHKQKDPTIEPTHLKNLHFLTEGKAQGTLVEEQCSEILCS